MLSRALELYRRSKDGNYSYSQLRDFAVDHNTKFSQLIATSKQYHSFKLQNNHGLSCKQDSMWTSNIKNIRGCPNSRNPPVAFTAK